MRNIAIGLALACLSLVALPGTAGAVDIDGVALSLEADRDAYYVSSLGSSPIVVTLTVANETPQVVQVTNNAGWLARVSVRPAPTMSTGGTITFPSCSPSSCSVLKFLFPRSSRLATVKPIKASTAGYSFSRGDNEQFWHIEPNGRRRVARMEIYSSDFNGLIAPGSYEVTVALASDFVIGGSFPTSVPLKERRVTTLIQLR